MKNHVIAISDITSLPVVQNLASSAGPHGSKRLRVAIKFGTDCRIRTVEFEVCKDGHLVFDTAMLEVAVSHYNELP